MRKQPRKSSGLVAQGIERVRPCIMYPSPPPNNTRCSWEGGSEFELGGLGGTRTPDALLRTEALYPLSYEAAKNLFYSVNTHVWTRTVNS